MHTVFDDDEWETVFSRTPCSTCNDRMAECDGFSCNGSSSLGTKRRAAADVAKIKADRVRREEDDILAKAEAIKARRAADAVRLPPIHPGELLREDYGIRVAADPSWEAIRLNVQARYDAEVAEDRTAALAPDAGEGEV